MIQFKRWKTYKHFKPFKFSRTCGEFSGNLPLWNYSLSNNMTFRLNVNLVLFGKSRELKRKTLMEKGGFILQ